MSVYYKRDGSRYPEGEEGMYQWAKDMEDMNIQRVALDQNEKVKVSTVWLGLNHQYGDGPPLIFESMVFGSEEEYEPQVRYSTEEEALAGHKELVEKYL